MRHTSPAVVTPARVLAAAAAVLLASLLALALPRQTAADEESVPTPILNVTTLADAEAIEAGQEAGFTVTIWNAGSGDALGVTWHDDLPAGIDWMFEVQSTHKPVCGIASSLAFGGTSQQSIDCDIGPLAPGDVAGGFVVHLSAQTDASHCGALLNAAAADASNLGPPRDQAGGEIPPWDVEASATLAVTCPPAPELDTETVIEAVEAESVEGPAAAPMLPDTAIPSPPSAPVELLAIAVIASMEALVPSLRRAARIGR